MIVSLYIPDLCSRRTKEENLETLISRLEMVKGMVQSELLRDLCMEAVIAGDFNRHNSLCGGEVASAARRSRKRVHSSSIS